MSMKINKFLLKGEMGSYDIIMFGFLLKHFQTGIPAALQIFRREILCSVSLVYPSKPLSLSKRMR